ncbi:MAG: hypothetical protein K0S71_545 [Clostridia bacterium]|jgi:hypothetical protein|nr:hypothetical protein [Clostridia bacterium]
METGYAILISLCIAAVCVLMCNISVIIKNKYLLLKIVCVLFFIFSMTRYFTLMIFGGSPTYNELMLLRYFYLASSIGLTIPTLSAIWYITPLYRDKISYTRYLLIFIPWVVFYLYVIITQPTEIIQGENFGYSLQLIGKYPLYLSLAQGSLVVIIILLCLVGILKYKNIQLRAQLIIIILAQITLVLDGFTYFFKIIHTFPIFTLSEIFGFLAVLYAFSHKMIEVRGIANK